MEFLKELTQIMLMLCGLKAILGFRWPWEPIPKAKVSLLAHMEAIKTRISPMMYREMKQTIEKI